uniref:Adhesion G protein-coupled receptor B N-terminal domain-containing protein n=1 Tax=Strix occidentalis caurina TaxID=311401 RepID=A0A8D0EU70_STROC
MTAAGPLLLAVISSLLWLTRGFDPAPSACSALASGVLYGSFSLKDLFPTISSGCSWTLENPDPTKYSLYLRFNREEQAASPPPARQRPEEEEEEEEAELELCEGAGPFTFLHFDKNFVQLCLAAEPEAAPRLLAPQALEFRFVEVLLINNNNSSQFTCSVLCRWLEECLQAPGARRCGFTHGTAGLGGHPGLPSTSLPLQPSSRARVRDAGGPLGRSGCRGGGSEEWSQWSVCSLTCGQGSQVRTRSCVSSPYGTLCSGLLRETRTCNNTATCPGMGGTRGQGLSCSVLRGRLWAGVGRQGARVVTGPWTGPFVHGGVRVSRVGPRGSEGPQGAAAAARLPCLSLGFAPPKHAGTRSWRSRDIAARGGASVRMFVRHTGPCSLPGVAELPWV